MKLNISIDDELMQKVDAYIKQNYMSRSGFFSMLANQHFQALQVTDSLKDITLSIRKVADTNEIDDETQKKLEDFERLTKLVNFKF